MEENKVLNKDISILVVDDIISARKVIIKLLNKAGYTKVFDSENISKAVEIISKNNIDLVISDYNIGEDYGYNLVEEVNKLNLGKEIPFILSTCSDKENLDPKILDYVKSTLFKPYSGKELESSIERAFSTEN
ncbi:MAG: response regulator [Proteobacteria bacterium]|nr:response regulator [Pseudomonadota bacterium]